MKFFKLSLTFLSIFMVFSFISTEKAYAETVVKINAENVNIREAAALDAIILGTLNTNQAIIPLGIEGEWVKFNYTNPEGQISLSYVSAQFVDILKVDAVITGDSVNIRISPDTSGNIIGKLNAGANIEVITKVNDFYAFTYNNSTAYVHSDFVFGLNLPLVIETVNTTQQDIQQITPLAAPSISTQAVSNPNSRYALVTSSNGINLRRGTTTESEIVAKIPYDDVMDVLDIQDGWASVAYNNMLGFVNIEFVSIHIGQKPDKSLGSRIVDYAKQFQGVKYKWGGTNLKSGVDCSGYTMSVYKNFGITINRTSREQYKNGTSVSKDQLKPGDLVFFDTNGSNNKSISHVGIYIGGGSFIHASSSKEYCVKISALSDSYYTKAYVGARRIVN